MAKRFIRGHLFKIDGVRYHRIAVYKKVDGQYKKIEDLMFQLPLTEADKRDLIYKVEVLFDKW